MDGKPAENGREMQKTGHKFVPDGLLLLRSNIHTKGNIFGVSFKAKWALGLELPTDAETVLYAGCGYQFLGGAQATLSAVRSLDRRGVTWEKSIGLTKFLNRLGINLGDLYGKLAVRSDLRANPLRCAVEVLRKAGRAFGYLYEDEPCCAAPLYYAGFQTEFATKATQTQRILEEKGVATLISMVPSCTYALQQLAPRFVNGWNLQIRHFLEVVRDAVRDGMQFSLPHRVKVTYHDPCVLSRFLNLIEEPREILNSIDGVELAEVEYTKGEWSTCCGGGGGFEVIFPEISHILATKRVNELVRTGASIIATSCPGCLIQLREGVKECEAQDVEVLDLAQLLYRALPED